MHHRSLRCPQPRQGFSHPASSLPWPLFCVRLSKQNQHSIMMCCLRSGRTCLQLFRPSWLCHGKCSRSLSLNLLQHDSMSRVYLGAKFGFLVGPLYDCIERRRSSSRIGSRSRVRSGLAATPSNSNQDQSLVKRKCNCLAVMIFSFDKILLSRKK